MIAWTRQAVHRNSRPLPGSAGGGLPARIWRSFMTEALNLPARPPKPPAQDEGEDDIGDMIARVLRRIGVTE